MEKDCYQIDVLYYLNPHLIWVEVVQTQSQQDFIFEQIGIYGILPYDTTIDIEGTVKSERCEEWQPSTITLMRQAFFEAKQIWFRPTYIDRSTSIFDDNIHKYGEIILTNAADQMLELSGVLARSGFAVSDICLFHQELSLGNLKTKLSYTKTQEVIRKLENDGQSPSSSTKAKKKREMSIKNKSTVFHEAENLKIELTEKNLRKHNLSASKIDKIVENKCKDFDRCKDIDEESAGRAVSVRRFENHKIIKEDVNNKKEATRLSNTCANKETEYKKTGKTDWDENLNRSIEDIAENTKNIQNNRKKTKKKSLKLPEIDAKTSKFVVYGPPGINPLYLPAKVVPKEEEENVVSKVEESRPEERSNTREMFSEVDSNVGIRITNIDVLKEKNSLNSSVEKKSDKDCSDVSYKSVSIVNESIDSKTEVSSVDAPHVSSRFAVMQKKLKLLKDIQAKRSDSSPTSHSDTTAKDSSSSDDDKIKKTYNYLDSDEEISPELANKINSEYPPKLIRSEIEKNKISNKIKDVIENNVNPFKNIDTNRSVFVEKLVTPVLMVHNKMNYPIQPCSNIRDVHFNTNIQIVLKNLGVERPMMVQMVSWPVILRGYSLFMVGPQRCGKTFGYLPAVCRLTSDECASQFIDSVGPSCIIVCATAQSVLKVERYAKMFLGLDEKVVSCYAGVDDLQITTSLLNGCDMFICTPSVLVRLLQVTDFGVDLRRLCTFVLEDFDRLSSVYSAEVKFFLLKIKEMLKARLNKELKVQFIVASRVWSEFMEPLAKKSPNSVVCISAFQECVLYSKTNTTVDFIKKENKIGKVVEFLTNIDTTKKTVVVCRSNDEVEEVRKVLTEKNHFVFSCDETMTLEDLYNLNKSWQDYEEPLLGPILVCCDGNLTHLNVTDANYLVHYSLPHLFSMFCKRFSVLNDNYSSIFSEKKDNVKIKIFLEENNAEQLPKILNFIKRCSDKIPEFLDKVCEKIVETKELIKASNLVPVCDNLLAFGECPDPLNCQERHCVFKQYDEPKDWVPRNGVVTFKILHYHTPTHYSVRLLSTTSNGETKKYPQTYSKLALKMGMYFSKESNQKLHGAPKVGDVCAVSLKQFFFVRCVVVKILTRYNNGNADRVLIKLIDEEKYEETRDVYLFHLPDELKNIDTHVVQVRLANVCPKDKDITYSDLARDELKKLTANEDYLFIRGKILLTIGNCILVDTLEACQELTSFKETVVMHDLKKELLNSHGIPNPEHIVKVEKLCEEFLCNEVDAVATKPVAVKQKAPLVPQWAHLDDDDFSPIYFASAVSPETFFIRLAKFESCMKLLLKAIVEYIESAPAPLESVEKGDIVLAKFPDDSVFERARIDDFVNEKVVKCFFVDQAEWRDVNIKDLVEIPNKIVDQLPFQAIECRLVGVKPAGDDWTEFGTNWFTDSTFDANGDPKLLYVKHFTKEEAVNTKGRKYGIVIIDKSSDQDVVINSLMLDLNLAQENFDEIKYLQDLDIIKYKDSNGGADTEYSDEDELEDLPVTELQPKNNAVVPVNFAPAEAPKMSLNDIFLKKPIRSVPLVDSDNESVDSWDIVNPKDLVSILKGITSGNSSQNYESPNNGGDGGAKPERLDIPCNRVYDNLNFKIVEDNHDQDIKATKYSVVSKVANIKNKNHLKLKEQVDTTLDSDDFSTEEVSQMSETSLEIIPKLDISEKNKVILDNMKHANFIHQDEKRKPKLVWRQNKTSVSIKIQLIGAEEYTVKLKDRNLGFEAYCNDITYGFDFDLYGVVENMTHSDKGQYILVKFCKVMKKNWLTLTKDGAIRKWIVYDVDGIDISSDEEEEPTNALAEVVKGMEQNMNSESEDDFLDDVKYEYGNFC